MNIPALVELGKKHWGALVGLLIAIYLMSTGYNFVWALILGVVITMVIYSNMKGGTKKDVEKDKTNP